MGKNISNNKKQNFTQKKDCCFNSIKEVEFFLSNLNKALKSFKFINYFK